MNGGAETVSLVTDTTVARRIRYTLNPAHSADVIRRFDGARVYYAVSETLDFDQLPAVTGGPEPTDELTLLILLGGSSAPLDLRLRAEQWMGRPGGSTAPPTVDAVAQGHRILWRPGRAAVMGAPEPYDDLLAALVDFSFYEGQLRRLEVSVDADYPTAERDIPLTHEVDGEALAGWPHVNHMTRTVTAHRMRYAGLAGRLGTPPAGLTGAVRQVIAELIVQTGVSERLAVVNGKMVVLERLYKLANDRLSHYAYFTRLRRLLWGSLLILGLALVVVMLEIPAMTR